jgi:hypothetical protein
MVAHDRGHGQRSFVVTNVLDTIWRAVFRFPKHIKAVLTTITHPRCF